MLCYTKMRQSRFKRKHIIFCFSIMHRMKFVEIQMFMCPFQAFPFFKRDYKIYHFSRMIQFHFFFQFKGHTTPFSDLSKLFAYLTGQCNAKATKIRKIILIILILLTIIIIQIIYYTHYNNHTH